MSYRNYPYHHAPGVCTIVHSPRTDIAEDYCTVCHDSFICAGVVDWIADSKGPDWEAALASCPHHVADKSEIEARDESKEIPLGHLSRWDRAVSDPCACVWEHYQVPDSFLTGQLWHDTAVVYHRCTVCGTTQPCPEIDSRGKRTCTLVTTP